MYLSFLEQVDVVIFDDDVGVHLPPHFIRTVRADAKKIGFRKRSKHPPRHEIDRLHTLWFRVSILNRLAKLMILLPSIPLFKLKKQHVLVYDDVPLAILFRCFGIDVSIRMTHLKYFELLPRKISNLIYKMLSMTAIRVYAISKVQSRYLKRFGLHCEVLPSISYGPITPPEQRVFKKKKGSVLYSGTLSGRNLIEHLSRCIESLVTQVDISELTILTPKPLDFEANAELQKISKQCALDFSVKVNPSYKEIYAFYETAEYGIAIYDYLQNPVLRQNFPLKTLEYLDYQMVVVGNKLQPHRELAERGHRFYWYDLKSGRVQDGKAARKSAAEPANR